MLGHVKTKGRKHGTIHHDVNVAWLNMNNLSNSCIGNHVTQHGNMIHELSIFSNMGQGRLSHMCWMLMRFPFPIMAEGHITLFGVLANENCTRTHGRWWGYDAALLCRSLNIGARHCSCEGSKRPSACHSLEDRCEHGFFPPDKSKFKILDWILHRCLRILCQPLPPPAVITPTKIGHMGAGF